MIVAMEDFDEILNDSLWVLNTYGRILESYSLYNYTLHLYSLGRDFIELCYDNDTGKAIWIMKANEDDLKKYLDRIELKIDRLIL